jgi:hypothetical protein
MERQIRTVTIVNGLPVTTTTALDGSPLAGAAKPKELPKPDDKNMPKPADKMLGRPETK